LYHQKKNTHTTITEQPLLRIAIAHPFFNFA